MGKTAVPIGPSPVTTPDDSASAEPAQASKIKHFVLDTNVLLHNPNSLYMFDDNTVVIPFTVLGELDKFKKNNDDTGRSSREVIRQLDRLRAKGTLAEGVPWNGHGGMVKVEFADLSNCEKRPDWFVEDTPDNRIIGVAWSLHQQGVRTVMITKDINVRLKSDALGITTEDFEAGKVDIDQLYGGYKTVDVPSEIIDQLYEEKQLETETIAEHLEVTYEDGSVGENEVFANEFVQLRDQFDESHTGLARRLADTDHLIPVQGPRRPVYGIMARNVQ
ncbi:MAG: PIN domain-containing protein, partial [Planctomycetota bacterium]